MKTSFDLLGLFLLFILMSIFFDHLRIFFQYNL